MDDIGVFLIIRQNRLSFKSKFVFEGIWGLSGTVSSTVGLVVPRLEAGGNVLSWWKISSI